VIVHEPEIGEVAGRTRVQARVESRHPKLAALGRLWFEVDAEHAALASDRADAFFVALLPVAMAAGEELELRGAVSPRLAWGLRELQRIHCAWWPRRVQRVEVSCKTLVEAPPGERGAGVATTFSGGVDSMYTLWSHSGERETLAPFRLTHALMINGFDLDVDLDETGRFRALRQIYTPLLAPLGIQLVTLRTNLRDFRTAAIERTGLLRSFGNALVAPALALQRGLGRLYLAAARHYQQFEEDGSQPTTDHLLGTESLHVIHDGADVRSRFAKTAVIADWPDGLARLRVCSDPTWCNVDVERAVVDNCGSCKKCIWTLVSLELATGRKTFPSFPRPVSRADVRWAAKSSIWRGPENLREALARGRRDIALDIRIGRAHAWLPRWIAPARGHRRRPARAAGAGERSNPPPTSPGTR